MKQYYYVNFFFPTIMGLVYQMFRLDINISMYICKIVMIKMIRNYLVELLIGKLSFKNIRKKKIETFLNFLINFSTESMVFIDERVRKRKQITPTITGSQTLQPSIDAINIV